ncbi:MAG: TROVE domain-containing protein [Oscillospiraceae bacterium]|nr:TROVE domain-containing protein [Oscillospiraceae bacterium]
MAKFNEPAQTIKTTNKEGHAAYSMNDKERLVTQALSTFFAEPKFYGSNDGEIVQTAAKIAESEPEFIAKLAAFARKEFNMRSISHVLAAILAHEPNGKKYIRRLVPGIAIRADDMTEILSAYLHYYGKPIPNSLKKGINEAFARQDEYTLAKYKGEQNSLKMRDLPRICHPVPQNGEQSDLWKRLIAGELATPYTWETELSAKGNTKEVWADLINSGKVGYMALLRNLRNILNAAPDNIGKVYEILADPDQVRKSRQLPFRFLSAYKELEGLPSASSKVFDALETAMDASVGNIPRINGKTAIAVDVSGSMRSPVSQKSKMSCAEIGLTLGVVAARICEESIFMTFDTKLYTPAVSTKGGILSQVRSIPAQGGGTDMELPFRHLSEQKIKVDRTIILSDNQCNYPYNGKTIQFYADEYKKNINSDVWVHSIDLLGYGTQQFAGPKTNIISGWAEKLLEFIALAESGLDALVKRIENVNL